MVVEVLAGPGYFNRPCLDPGFSALAVAAWLALLAFMAGASA